QTVPSEMPDKQLFTFRVPVGSVAVVTAGNFPVAVPSWYLVPALVTGNTVVWKPAEYAAASAMALFELLQAAGLPPGVLNIVFAGFGTAGQRCTSLGTVIVHESVHDEFLARFATAVSAAAVGDPARDVVYGPMLDQKFATRFEEYLGWIQPHHKVLGSTGLGRISGANPRDGFVGD